MKIFETTLRDGEQAAFIHLEPRQKADIAVSLEAMGVDIIDSGFPAASKLDWEGAYAIADATNKVQLSVLTRGKAIEQYPLLLIGVDYNEASLTASTQTLADLPLIVL